MSVGTVTAIDRVPGLRSARRISVDHDVWRVTSAAVLRELALEPGDERDLDALSAEIDAAERAAARARALRLVAMRERSTAEVRQRLIDDGYPAALAVEIADSLAASGYVDDARHAKMLARTLVEVRRFGRARAARDLRARGVGDEAVETILEELCAPGAEAERALELARSLSLRCREDPMRVARRLVTRGFAPGLALKAAREACTSPFSPGETDGSP